MTKLKKLSNGYYSFQCPGCDGRHTIPTTPPHGWEFNGDIERPTFKPSILMNGDKGNPGKPRCHSFVTDGQIQFLDDCTHSLAGKTVPMEDVRD